MPAIVAMLDQPGLEIVGMKFIPMAEMADVESHYECHLERDFYPWLVDSISGKSIYAVVVRGVNAVARVRAIAGDTKPEEAAPGTIRARFKDDLFSQSREEQRAVRNVVHTSDGVRAAKVEIMTWFNRRSSDEVKRMNV